MSDARYTGRDGPWPAADDAGETAPGDLAAADALALALGALESPRKAEHLEALVQAVQALARLREEDSARWELVERRLYRAEKVADLTAGRVDEMARRIGPEDDGR